MSQDQKPGKMRVVGNAPAAPQRRRDDVESGSPPEVPAIAVSGATAMAAPATKKPVLLLVILFLVGCAAGGVAFPLLGVV